MSDQQSQISLKVITGWGSIKITHSNNDFGNSVELDDNESNLNQIGKSILDLSKLNIYDRIIEIKCGNCKWMKPLLTDAFTSLISWQYLIWLRVSLLIMIFYVK